MGKMLKFALSAILTTITAIILWFSAEVYASMKYSPRLTETGKSLAECQASSQKLHSRIIGLTSQLQAPNIRRVSAVSKELAKSPVDRMRAAMDVGAIWIAALCGLIGIAIGYCMACILSKRKASHSQVPLLESRGSQMSDPEPLTKNESRFGEIRKA